MKFSSCLNFEELDPIDTLMIVSPGNLGDMVNYPQACKVKGIDYIFDPGQSIPMLSAEDLRQSIEGCRIMISNDYELELIMNKTKLKKGDLLKRAGAIIVTLGELGSRVITPDGEVTIPVVMPKKVEDPTGAGDSYRGGLISGLVRGMDIEEAARIGSVCASFTVECYGTQEYRFSKEEFDERFKNCFG
jgi:adenosine kinase